MDDEVRFPTWDDGYNRTSRLKRTTKNLDTAPSLVRYLEDEFRLHLEFIGAINQAAMRGTFASWIRNGISPQQIRDMIRIYTTDKQFQKGNGPHWKRFIYHRDTLLERTATLTSNVESDSYWNEPVKEEEFKWD